MPFVNAAVAAFHCRFSPHTAKTEFPFQKRSVVGVTRVGGCHSCCIRWILLHCIPPHHHKPFQFSDFTLNGEKNSIHCVIMYTCHKNWKRIFRSWDFYFSEWREKKVLEHKHIHRYTYLFLVAACCRFISLRPAISRQIRPRVSHLR